MTRRLLVIVLGLSANLFADKITNATQDQTTHTDRLDFAPGGTIHIEGSTGSLIVDGWDEPAVEVTVVKAMPYYYDKKKGEQRLERVKISAERKSPAELAISTVLPPKGFPLFTSPTGKVIIDYQVHVPRDSHVVIHHGSGYVMVSNVSGEIEATSGSGDIMVLLPDPGPYNIDAKSKFGTVLSDFSGDDHVQHLVGERFAAANAAPAKRVYLRVGRGGVTIKELQLSAAKK
jgi:hypothetical protein